MTRHAQLRHQDEAFSDFHYNSGFFYGLIVGIIATVVVCSIAAIALVLVWGK